jgi:hypothetical protein
MTVITPRTIPLIPATFKSRPFADEVGCWLGVKDVVLVGGDVGRDVIVDPEAAGSLWEVRVSVEDVSSSLDRS